MAKQGIIASLFWAANIILIKIFLNQFDSHNLALYKALLSSLMLLVIIKEKMVLDKKEIVILTLTGLFSVYLNYFFSYQGIKEASMGDISLINALTLVFSRDQFDRFSLLVLLAFLIGFRGNIPIYLWLSMACYVIGMRLSRKSQLPYMSKTMISLFFGSLFFLPSFEVIQFSFWEWLLFLGISVLGYGYIMYVYMKTSNKNVYLNLHPILTYLASLLFFSEPFEPTKMIAFFIVFIAIILEGKKLNKD